VPKGTPKEVLTTLNNALRETLADPDTKAKLAALSQDIFPPEQQRPQALATFQAEEIQKW
jgi:tripartite-type tricarboxylate transporter receptor subunit TctC